MFLLPYINKLKFKTSNKSKTKMRNLSIYPKKIEKTSKSINNFPSSPINSNIINCFYPKNRNKHNIKNSFSVFKLEKESFMLNKILNNQTTLFKNSNMKTETEIITNIFDNNTKPKNEKCSFTFRENYNKKKGITSNKSYDKNKSLKEKNLLSLQNNSIFLNPKDLFNYKIKNETPLKDGSFSKLNPKLINKALFNKNEIKKEYKRTIKEAKQFFNLRNKTNDLFNNKNNTTKYNSFSLVSNLNSTKVTAQNDNDNNLNLERNKRNKKIIQSNSLNIIFSGFEKYNKELKINNSNKNEIPKHLFDGDSSHKEIIENFIDKIIFKNKIDNLRKKRLKDIIKKQKNIINNYIKFKEEKKSKIDNSIKFENSLLENIPGFTFFSKIKIDHTNKNEDIINCITNSDKSIKFENSLIKEKIGGGSLLK